MGPNAGKPLIIVASVTEWEAWLAANPGVDGVRLRLRKKNSAAPGITYPEALDSALCFGWIEGRMRPTGLAEVDRANADGRWDAAYRQKDAPVPADLHDALSSNPAAAEFFATLSAQNRFAILFRLANVKREETRRAKIVSFVAMLESRETIYPQSAR